MDYFESITLGIVQGLTEFLPISSSGHLEISKAILGNDFSNAEIEREIKKEWKPILNEKAAI